MCDRGLAEDMYEVAQRDDTTINALTVLHNHDYDCKRAIQALVKCPIPKGIDRKWSDDDQKKFIKGIRQYGKNFFRIRKDLLPHKQTSDLIEYYYLWKKTPQAQSSRPRRRHQRPCSNLSTTPTKQQQQRSTKTNIKDESDEDNQLTTDLDIQSSCRHCQILSKDLQIIGRDNQLLCYECRMYYKKYGEMPSVNLESSRYLFKPLNDTSSSTRKRKRSKALQSPDDNNSSLTRSKKRTRIHEKLSSIKQEAGEEDEDDDDDVDDGDDEDEEMIIKKEEEEQENEKPSSSINSSLFIKTEDLILTPTPCKQELHSPSTHLSNHTSKILIDHTKQNHTGVLLSSPSSAFSRTSRKSLLFKDSDTIPNDDITPTVSLQDNDDGNTSDNSTTTTNHESISDEGPTPLLCEKECYNKSQGIILLQTYDRSISQNSCARTDIILKRGSRTRRKPTEQHEIPPLTPIITNIKQEDRNSSKISFPLDKGLSMSHPPFSHHDPLFMNHNNSLFHPLPLHALSGGPKSSFGFPSPFGPSPHDSAALRHLDPFGLRMMNSSAASAAQFFAAQSPFSAGMGRPPPAGFDPTTAALLLDPRYRSMMSPFSNNTSPSSIVPLPSSSSSTVPHNGTHNHAHVHSHSHTHLHVNNANDPSSSSAANGPSLPPPPPPPPPHLLSFPNPLSGLSHGNPLLHFGGPSSLEAMHNLARERELMSMMFANNNRLDPMSLALANSFQMPRLDDLSRMNARERSIREHNENEFRRMNFEMERQQFRFPFHHQPAESFRRY